MCVGGGIDITFVRLCVSISVCQYVCALVCPSVHNALGSWEIQEQLMLGSCNFLRNRRAHSCNCENRVLLRMYVPLQRTLLPQNDSEENRDWISFLYVFFVIEATL